VDDGRKLKARVSKARFFGPVVTLPDFCFGALFLDDSDSKSLSLGKAESGSSK